MIDRAQDPGIIAFQQLSHCADHLLSVFRIKRVYVAHGFFVINNGNEWAVFAHQDRETRGCHELFVRNKAVHDIHNQALSLGWHIKHRGTRTNYPSDLSDEEWAFCARYLTLMREDAPQRDYPLRATFNALRYMVRAGCSWRMMPNGIYPLGIASSNKPNAGSGRAALKPWPRICARCCGCLPAGARNFSAVILDGRTLQSTPERGAARVTTAVSAKRVPRFMPRSILWVIFWP